MCGKHSYLPAKRRCLPECVVQTTDRVESWEEAHRRGCVQGEREELLHGQRGLDGGHGGTHQGGHEAILTCVTCRRGGGNDSNVLEG